MLFINNTLPFYRCLRFSWVFILAFFRCLWFSWAFNLDFFWCFWSFYWAFILAFYRCFWSFYWMFILVFYRCLRLFWEFIYVFFRCLGLFWAFILAFYRCFWSFYWAFILVFSRCLWSLWNFWMLWFVVLWASIYLNFFRFCKLLENYIGIVVFCQLTTTSYFIFTYNWRLLSICVPPRFLDHVHLWAAFSFSWNIFLSISWVLFMILPMCEDRLVMECSTDFTTFLVVYYDWLVPSDELTVLIAQVWKFHLFLAHLTWILLRSHAASSLFIDVIHSLRKLFDFVLNSFKSALPD